MPNIKATFQGSRVTRKSATTRYHVTGLDTTTPEKMWDALFAGGLPSPEDPHPRNPDLVVDDVGVSEMVGEHAAFVEVNYKPRATDGGGGTVNGVEVEMDGSLVSVVTLIDYGGKPIKVIYNPVNGQPQAVNRDEVNVGAGERGQASEGVEMLLGLKTLRFSRTEDVFPVQDRWQMLGKTNSNAGWVFPQDVGLWLCSRVSAKLAAGANKPTVNYEFQGPEDGWEKITAYIEPTTGKLPEKNMGKIALLNVPEPRVRGSFAAANEHQDRSLNGITIVRVQGSADFNTLGLPSVYA